MRSLFAIIIMFVSSCSDEPSFEPKYEVPVELQSIVDQFVVEAASRNQSIEINNLIIEYDSSLEACGRCNSTSLQKDIQKVITINPNRLCWSSDLQQETLLFHELGHCVLGRFHTDELLPNGDPKSLMVDDNTSLYTGCVYQFGEDDDCNHAFKREYYLDELFDVDTPIPSWGN